jgi:hypothetical protein
MENFSTPILIERPAEILQRSSHQIQKIQLQLPYHLSQDPYIPTLIARQYDIISELHA